MKKINLILILFFITNIIFAQAEKDSLLKRDIDAIVDELQFMYCYDQAIREYTIYKTFDKHKIDSIENMSDSLREIAMKNIKFYNDTLAKKIWGNYINPKDAEHTERLLEITKIYGFPSIERIRKYYKKDFVDLEFHANLIFIHSPKIYWNELKELMKKEYENGNINQCIYGYLLWHFNGRGNLQSMLDNGWVFLEKDGKKVLTSTCK
jgi:hypothetical protein